MVRFLKVKVSKLIDCIALLHPASRAGQLHYHDPSLTSLRPPSTPHHHQTTTTTRQHSERYYERSLALGAPSPPVPAPRARREDRGNCPTNRVRSLHRVAVLINGVLGLAFRYRKESAGGYGYRC